MPSQSRDEQRVIAILRRLAENWPASLWISSDEANLCVLRFGTDGKPGLHEDGSIDLSYAVAWIPIPGDNAWRKP